MNKLDPTSVLLGALGGYLLAKAMQDSRPAQGAYTPYRSETLQFESEQPSSTRFSGETATVVMMVTPPTYNAPQTQTVTSKPRPPIFSR